MDGRPFDVLGLDHVVLRVRDLEASLRFYRDVLGCPVERRVERLGLVQLRAGRALVDLVPVEGPLGRARGGPPDPARPNVDHVALRIDPFDEGALRAYLARHGIEASPAEPRYGAEGTGPSVYVRDPDGNVIELKGPPGHGS